MTADLRLPRARKHQPPPVPLDLVPVRYVVVKTAGRKDAPKVGSVEVIMEPRARVEARTRSLAPSGAASDD